MTELLPTLLIGKQVIEAYMWLIQAQNPHVFCATTTMPVIALLPNRSTRLLWSEEDFSAVTKLFIPMNTSGTHWTLLVSACTHTVHVISQCTELFASIMPA